MYQLRINTMLRASSGLGLMILAGIAWGFEDPTKPSGLQSVATVKQAGAVSFRLQGVLVRGGAEKALINDRWIKVGQKTSEFTLLKIFSDSVEIEGAKGDVQRLWLTAKIKEL